MLHDTFANANGNCSVQNSAEQYLVEAAQTCEEQPAVSQKPSGRSSTRFPQALAMLRDKLPQMEASKGIPLSLSCGSVREVRPSAKRRSLHLEAATPGICTLLCLQVPLLVFVRSMGPAGLRHGQIA